MMPALFIAHGAPLLAIENNEYTHFLSQLGKELERPKAIVIFSAHWEARTQQVSGVNEYDTIYDFGGFPQALYNIKYEAKGDHTVTERVMGFLQSNNIPTNMNGDRGLDHGAWVVLRMLYPHADIPVIAMSVNPQLKPEEQYEVGKALQILKEEDVLFIASGGLVHNLRAINMTSDHGEVDEWAMAFEQWIEEKVMNWDVQSLFQYEKEAPNASLAVPPYGKEHFIPLFYAMGAGDQEKKATLLHRSFRYGNLSHTVWQFA